MTTRRGKHVRRETREELETKLERCETELRAAGEQHKALEYRLAALVTEMERSSKFFSSNWQSARSGLEAMKVRRDLIDRWRFELETAAREVIARLEKALMAERVGALTTVAIDVLELRGLISELKRAVSDRGIA